MSRYPTNPSSQYHPHHSPLSHGNIQPSNTFDSEEGAELTLRDYYETILRYRFTVILIVFICFFSAIGMHFFLPKEFQATTLLLRNEAVSSRGDMPLLAAFSGTSSSYNIETLQQIAFSDDILHRTIPTILLEFERSQTQETKIPKEEQFLMERLTPGMITNVTSMTTHPDSEDIIRISVRMKNAPYLSSIIANSLSLTLIDSLIEKKEQKFHTQIENLITTINNNSMDIKSAEAHLKQLLNSGKGVSLGDNDLRLSNKLDSMEQQIKDAQLEKREIEDQIRLIRIEFNIEHVPLEKVKWIDTSSSMHQKLQELQFNREVLLTRYKPENPSIKKLNNQIASLQETLTPDQDQGWHYVEVDRFRMPTTSHLLSLQAQAGAMTNKITFIQSEYDKLSQQLLEAPKEQKEVREIQDKLEMMGKIHLDLHKSLYKAKMMLLSTNSEFEIMERATPNLNSSSPGLVKFSVMGLVLGLALSFGVALFLNSCENTLRNTTDIKRHFSYPALGAVPSWDKDNKYIDEMVPDSTIAEVYGILRNNVRFSNFSHPEKCLLVASPSQQEGKSLMAINLSLSFALEGNSVLLISADLRRPFSHTLFRKKEDIKKTLGIVEYLDESANLDDVIYTSHFSNLSFIPTCARASNPTKLLKSPRFKEMLNYGEKNYDVVIIDAPAILPVVDATLISPMVKGVLIVAKASQSTTSAIQDSLTRLEHVGSPIMGISLNMIKDLKLEIFYGYGHDKYMGYNG